MTQEPQAAVLPSSHVQQQPFGPEDPSALLWALLISSSSPAVCALTHTRTHSAISLCSPVLFKIHWVPLSSSET